MAACFDALESLPAFLNYVCLIAFVTIWLDAKILSRLCSIFPPFHIWGLKEQIFELPI
jgi:uncharacterized membrane protein (DUF485 family)